MNSNRQLSVNSQNEEIRPLLSTSQEEEGTLLHSRENSSPNRTKNSPPKKNIEEDQSRQRIRQPVNYNPINTPGLSHEERRTSAVISRYKYYNSLAPHHDGNFVMPDHVVPEDFISYIIMPIRGKQSSIITIFSLWNTMMGTSILSMPWAIQQAGFATGVGLLVFMAGVMLYTSYRILISVQQLEGDGRMVDFSDVCKYYLGKWAQYLAVGSSLLTLLCSAIVYWILMTNFLYNVVLFIYHKVNDDPPVIIHGNDSNPDIVCKTNPPVSNNTSLFGISSHAHDEEFDKVWNVAYSVPFFLILVLGPLVNFKSPTFFTKFNALGTLSVTYLVCFVITNAAKWGINVEFGDESQTFYAPDFKGTFPTLTGISALAYFVQNCCVSICRNQKCPENNVRDLTIAYILVAATYIFVGVMFYISFPMSKDCIEDNLLNNMADTYVLAFVARVGLFFQMMCVFPLLLYIFRIQLLHSLFNSIWPSLLHVLVLNICIIAVCVIFAVFLPHIGKIIAFVGAFCGFSYAILLPCLVHLTVQHQARKQSMISNIIHSILIILGLANFIGQFVILN